MSQESQYPYKTIPSQLVFQAECTEQTKVFSVPCLPLPLRTIVSPSLDKTGMLDYSEYLQRSFILEESILLPLLAILKDHLEEYQVFLGKVESWLMESTRNATFLRKTFNVKLGVGQGAGQQSVLKNMNLPNDKTMYDLYFDVTAKNGQEKLTKFLGFITHNDKTK